MSAEQAGPDKADGPLSSLVEGVKLPAVKASQIVNEIADQAPLYGLSGAILAVGLVTGRRALARTGAQMLTSQIIAALARAASDRLLPPQTDAKKAAGSKAAVEPQGVAEPPMAQEPATPGRAASAAKIATGTLAGAAALAAGGWLLSRLLKPKSSGEG
jgi:hypothetical protein